MFGLVLHQTFTDHVQQEAHIIQSDLEWTIVRPSAFTAGAQTGVYRHGFKAADKVKLQISRADVADFMLKQLTDDTYVCQTPGLSY